MSRRIYDITLSINGDLAVWPGSEKPRMTRVQSIPNGDQCNLTDLEFGAHTGTHLDAPLHFVDGGIPVEQLDLEVLVGRAHLIEFDNSVEVITASDLEGAEIPGGTTRLLVKTRNSAKWETDPATFNEDYVAIAPDAARWIVGKGIKLVGIDHLSVAPYREDYLVETHVILLGAGIIAVEGLRLGAVRPGSYELVCLPLKLEGSDGAPCRAILLDNQG